MAFSKARRLSDFIAADGTVPATKFATGTITSAMIADTSITPTDLHTSLDLTGKTVTVATASGSTNTTAAASTAFVQQELTTLIGGAPSTLNDLNELAAAINDDSNYNSTLTTALATKLPLAGGTMTGNLTFNSESPNITLSDTSTSRTLAMFVDDNNSVVRASGPLLLQVGSQSALTIDTSRHSLFGGNIDVTGTITGDDGLSIQGGAGNAYLQVGSNTGSWTWKNYQSTHKLALEDSDGTGEVLNFDTSGNATFAGEIIANKALRLQTTDDQAQQWYVYTHTDDTFRINYNGAGSDALILHTDERMQLLGPLIVGGASDSQAGSITLQGDGDIRGVLASGAGGDTLISAISGVSNGFQIQVDSSNNQSYKFHIGSTPALTIGSTGITTLASGQANLGTLQLSSQAATYQLTGGNNLGYLGYKTGGYHRWFGSDGVEEMRLSADQLLVPGHATNGGSPIKMGSTAVTQYVDFVQQTNSGTAEFFKAGTGYTSWGGASALNIYNSNEKIAFHPFGNQNVVQMTAAGIVMDAGKGISFGNNANYSGMSSEVLDDYESGTWTPTLGTEAVAGSSSSGNNNNKYVKIGRLVHLTGWFNAFPFSTITSGTYVMVRGLPFRPEHHSTSFKFSYTQATLQGGTYGYGHTSLYACYILVGGSTGAASHLTRAAIGAPSSGTTHFMFDATYYTND